jgi:hypothetical protein
VSNFSSGTIAWGDATSTSMSGSVGSAEHTYGSNGQKTVTASGSTTNGGSFQAQGRVTITGAPDFPSIMLGAACWDLAPYDIDGQGTDCDFALLIYFEYEVRDNDNTYSVASYTFTIDGTSYTLDTHELPTDPDGSGLGYIYNTTAFQVPKENGHIPYVLTATLNTGATLTASGTLDLTCE